MAEIAPSSTILLDSESGLRENMPIDTFKSLGGVLLGSNRTLIDAFFFSPPNAEASLAPSANAAVLILVNVIATLCIFVAMLTVGFTAIGVSILPMAQQVQMIWIAASSISAFMIHFQMLRYFTFKKHVRDSMCLNQFPPFNSSVTVRGDGSCPVPASRHGVDLIFLIEAFEYWSFSRHKKAADPLLLNQAHEMPRAGNRLLNLMFSYLSAVQCRCDSFLHSTLSSASSFRTVPQPCRAAHAAGRS